MLQRLKTLRILTTVVSRILITAVSAVVIVVTDPLAWNTDIVVTLELVRSTGLIHCHTNHHHSDIITRSHTNRPEVM